MKKKLPERVAVRCLRRSKELICNVVKIHILSGSRYVRSLTSLGIQEQEDGV